MNIKIRKKIISKNLSFSIITPVLNDKRILNVINSLKKQTYKNFEHIIIDGGSKPNVLNIIKKNEQNIDIWVSAKDNGIYDAINKGIKMSSGDIIGILNADDVYFPKTLEIAKNYFNNKKIDFLFGTVIKDRLLHGFWPDKIWWKFNIYPAHSCGFFVKRIIHKKVGLYDTKFKFSSDRDFIFKLIKKNYKGLCTNKKEIFGKFNTKGISSQISYFRTIFEEFHIRLNHKQNIVYLFFLLILTLLNKLYNFIFKGLR
jgi:glycosyltransferase involved in cell wall biosynthesis